MSFPLFTGKIVHFYVDEALNKDYCQKTFQIVAALRDKYPIESVCNPKEDYAYWKNLKERWALDDLVIIEQDIVFTEEQLVELLECEHRDCTYACKLYPATTLLPEPVWSIGENHLPNRIRLYTLEEKPEFCNFSAIGFIKLSLETQKRVMLNTPTHWKFVDLAIFGEIKDLKLHVHYEVEHGHGAENGDGVN